ncbi:MAG: dihydrofolate reductase, partial [Bacteroidia bacterium]|nr:dihydrofolate reductase [Bacteroidia bacterium]
MRTYYIISTVILFFMISCTSQPAKEEPKTDDFQFFLEKFSDTKILRYPVPGFDQLPLQQKELIYYLSQAAVEGRDIMFDQNYRHNLAVRRTLEAIFENFTGDRTTAEFQSFLVYLKRVWFANGIHHHYSTDKFEPGFSAEYFKTLLDEIDETKLPLPKNEIEDKLIPVLFDPAVDAKRVN